MKNLFKRISAHISGKSSLRVPSLIEPLEARIAPATFTWNNAAGGSWTTPANWTVTGGTDADGIPDADDDVTFNPAAAGALLTIAGGFQAAHSLSIPGDDLLQLTNVSFSLGANSTINGLQLSGGSISVNGLLTLTGDGSSIGGTTLAGTFRNEGTLALTNGTIRLDGATLDNAGTITQTGGQLYFQNGSPAFHNLAGAVYEVNTQDNAAFLSYSFDAPGRIFDNAGTLRRDGSGTPSFGGMTFHNAATGVIEVLSGGLQMNAFGSMDGGVFNVSSGATLSLQGINQSWSGNFTGSGAGTVNFGGGTIAPGNAAFNFPSGMFVLDTSAIFSGGTLTNLGSLSLAPTAGNGIVRLDGATLNNAGTFTQTGGILAFQGANPAFHNFTAGLYEVKTAAGNGSFVGSGGLFDNEGTLRRDGSGAATAPNANFHNAATGVIEVLNGTLLLNSFGSMDGGVFNVSAGATLSFENVNQTWSGNFTGSGAGTVVFRGGTIALGNATFNFPDGMFLWDNEGLFSGGTLTNEGAITIGQRVVRLDSATLNNAGTITQTDAQLFFQGTNSALHNLAGAVFESTSSNNGAIFSSGGLFDNAGTFRRDGGGAATMPNTNFHNAATGVIEVLNGTLLVNATGAMDGGTFNVSSGATLSFENVNQTWSGNFTGSGGGTITFKVGTIALGDATFNFPSGMFLWDNEGLFSGGTLTNTGAITIGDRLVRLDSATFNNAGTITQTNAQLIFQGTNSVLHNLPGGLFEANNFTNGAFLGGAGGLFDNAGTLRRDELGTASTGGVPFSNTGTVEVASGNLVFNGPVVQISGDALTGGMWEVQAGGTLDFGTPIATNSATLIVHGTGELANLRGPLTANTGTLDLRDGAAFATMGDFSNGGLLIVGPGSIYTAGGAFTQTAAGRTEFQIADTATNAIGKVISTAAAQLDGTAVIRLVNGFGPAAGDQFTVATFPSHIGDFAAFDFGAAASFLSAATGATSTVVSAIAGAADLAVTSITAPASGFSGQTVTIDYNVRNLSPTPAVGGPWVDTLYLSKDSVLDPSDVLIGRVTHTGDVAGGASYNASLTADLSGVLPGQYRVLVLADSRALVPDGNRANNLLAAASATQLDIAALTPGVPVTGTIANGADVFYRVELPAGKTPIFTATFGANGAAELLTAQLFVPSEDVSDGRGFSPGSNNVQLLGSTLLAGTYYIRLHGAVGAGTGTSFTLEADSLDFTLTTLEHDRGANVGTLTTTLRGSEFDAGTQFSIVLDGGNAIPAQKVILQDQSLAYVTFDLTGLPLGDYDVLATEGAATATLPNALHVVQGVEGEVTYQMTAPRFIRANFEGIYATITYQNAGDTDLVAPIFSLTGENGYYHLRGEEDGRLGSIELLAINPDGPAGVLPPGATGELIVEFYPIDQRPHALVNFTLSLEGPDDGVVFDWVGFKDDLRPASTPLDAWNAIYGNFVAEIGTTFERYHEVVAENATYLSLLGERTADVGKLISYELLQANDFGSIASRYQLGSLGRGNFAPWEMHAVTAPPSHTLPDDYDPLEGFTVLRDANGAVGAIIQTALLRGAAGGGAFLPLSTPVPRVPSLDERAGVEGNVTIMIGSEVRTFISIGGGGSLAPGEFVPVGNDTGSLERLSSGALKLTEQDGMVIMFRASDGALDYFEDSNGYRVTASYDADGHVTSLTESNGDVTGVAYNAQGRIATITDSVGRPTTFTYDAGGEHLLTRTTPLGTTTYSYVSGQGDASEHALASETFPDGSMISFTYDSHGRLVSQERNGATERLTYEYDSIGSVTQTDRHGNATTVFRDLNANSARTVDALGNISSTYFNNDGRAVASIEPGGVVTTVRYDSLGAVSDLIDAAAQRVGFAHDGPFHLLSSVTDTRGNSTDFAFDAAGNLKSITDALGNASSFSYDSLGRVTLSVNERMQSIGYTYDAKGLLVFKDLPGTADDVTYAYDAHRNLTSAASAADGATTYAYDSADRLTKVTYPNGKFVAYTYDAGGRRETISDDSGFTVRYSYDAIGRLDKITDAANATLDDYDYDTVGRLTKETHGNGSTTDYAYDALGRTSAITHRAPDNSVIESFTYSYDVAGHVATQTSSVTGTTSYGYDANGQLTSVALPGGRTITYAYDTEGNRTIVNDSATGTTAYTANEINEYTAVGTAIYSYDESGNLTARGGGAQGSGSFTYDVQGRLIAATTVEGSFTYDYDAAGNRIGMTKDGGRTDFVLDPTGLGSVFAEYDASGALAAHFTEGLGLASRVDASGAASYYHYDLSGNTQLLTGAGGAVVATYDYLPFGEKIGATGTMTNEFTFSGRFGVQENGSGLYDLRARAYDPQLGRFLQQDPIGLAGGDTNLYRYAGNAPVDRADPAGLFDIFISGGGEITVGRGITGHAGFFISTDFDAGIFYGGGQTVGLSGGFGGIIGITPSVGGDSANVVASLGPATGSVQLGDNDRPIGGAGGLAFGAPVGVILSRTDSTKISVRTIAKAAFDGGVALAKAGAHAGINGIGKFANGIDQFGRNTANGFTGQFEDDSGINNARANQLTKSALQDPAVQNLTRYFINLGDDPTTALDTARRLIKNHRNNQVHPPHDVHTTSEVIAPNDPNNIVGPNGIGADPIPDIPDPDQMRFEGFVKAEGDFGYTILFENKASASAPAQVVTITQTLDSDLDWSTFQLGSFSFGDIVVEVPTGRSSYHTVLDFSATRGFLVDFDAGIDLVTGIASWTLTTLDPITHDSPSDPLVGFLPPNVTAPEGDGAVAYAVAPKANLASGTNIDAQASIVFDTEAPIATPLIHNTIDSLAPQSSITPFAGATNTRGAFSVAVSGSDEAGGSGLNSTAVFFTDNGGPLQPLVTDATVPGSFLFAGGQAGHIYSFFSQAVDNVGNTEPLAATPDATISVVAPTLIPVDKKLTLTDSDGDKYSVKIKGPGTLNAVLLDPDGDGNGSLDQLFLTGGSTKTKVSVSVKGKGSVDIGDFNVEGDFGSFTAKKSDLVYNGVIATGSGQCHRRPRCIAPRCPRGRSACANRRRHGGRPDQD